MSAGIAHSDRTSCLQALHETTACSLCGEASTYPCLEICTPVLGDTRLANLFGAVHPRRSKTADRNAMCMINMCVMKPGGKGKPEHLWPLCCVSPRDNGPHLCSTGSCPGHTLLPHGRCTAARLPRRGRCGTSAGSPQEHLHMSLFKHDRTDSREGVCEQLCRPAPFGVTSTRRPVRNT